MTPLELLSLRMDRYAEQVTRGEWYGAGERDWLSQRWPCGRQLCAACKGTGGRRGVVWSKVMGGEQ